MKSKIIGFVLGVVFCYCVVLVYIFLSDIEKFKIIKVFPTNYALVVVKSSAPITLLPKSGEGSASGITGGEKNNPVKKGDPAQSSIVTTGKTTNIELEKGAPSVMMPAKKDK